MQKLFQAFSYKARGKEVQVPGNFVARLASVLFLAAVLSLGSRPSLLYAEVEKPSFLESISTIAVSSPVVASPSVSLACIESVCLTSTYEGVYGSSDGGTSWSKVSSDSPSLLTAAFGQFIGISNVPGASTLVRFRQSESGSWSTPERIEISALKTVKEEDAVSSLILINPDELLLAFPESIYKFNLRTFKFEAFFVNTPDGWAEAQGHKVVSALATDAARFIAVGPPGFCDVFELTPSDKDIANGFKEFASKELDTKVCSGDNPETPIKAQALRFAENHWWLATTNALYEFDNRIEDNPNRIPFPRFVTEIQAFTTADLPSGKVRILMATRSGLLRSDDLGKTWSDVTAGLPICDTITALACQDDGCIARSQCVYDSVSEDENPPGEDEQSTSLTNGPTAATEKGPVALGSSGGFYRFRFAAQTWNAVAQPQDSWTEPNTRNPQDLFYLDDDGTVVLVQRGFNAFLQFRSRDHGDTWKKFDLTLNGTTGIPLGPSLTFAHQIFRFTSDGVVQSLDNGKSWSLVVSPADLKITALAKAGDDLLAGTSAGTVLRRSFKSSHELSEWVNVPSVGLSGVIRSLWVDQRSPNVIVTASSAGLFWSNDSGNTFHKRTIARGIKSERAYAVDKLGDRFYVAGSFGLARLIDRIQRSPGSQSFVVDELKDNWRTVAGLAGSLFVLIFFSSRLILLVLQLDLWPINAIAPFFYLTRLGRWKLYHAYMLSFRKDPILLDLRTKYLDLPYLSNRTTGALLPQLLTAACRDNVVLLGGGGSGKTTVCRSSVVESLEHDAEHIQREIVPIFLEGLGYTGDLRKTILVALRSRAAFLNASLLEAQLLRGEFLVVLDGFSEIRQEYAASAAEEVPMFVSTFPSVHFLISSRSELPVALLHSLRDPAVFRLQALDADTEEDFLARYLKDGPKAAHVLAQEIHSRLPGLPRIPLLLALIASTYDRLGELLPDRASIFGEYARHLLRAEATGIPEPAGLIFAIRHLVRQTFVISGGDRGFTLEHGVELLREIRPTLQEGWGLNQSAVMLLRLLISAGLLQEVGEFVTFFHDSFESYFAARALQMDIRDRRYDLALSGLGNERLSETGTFLREILTTEEKAELLRRAASLAPDAVRDRVKSVLA